MSDEPADYVVIRRGTDVPAEWYIGDLEGRWFDRSQVLASRSDPESVKRFRERGGVVSGAQAVPTGRFEIRESDGAVAEVWELLPLYI